MNEFLPAFDAPITISFVVSALNTAILVLMKGDNLYLKPSSICFVLAAKSPKLEHEDVQLEPLTAPLAL